jgi:hypothetical protein
VIEPLAGLNVWAIDLDGKGSAIKALSASTRQLTDAILHPPDPADPLSECQWSDCIDTSKTCPGQGLGGLHGTESCQGGCPDGLSESWRSYGGIDTCGSSTQFRMFCCPATGRPDRCRDRQDVQRFETQCVGRCSGSEVKIATNAIGCLSGWNEICCTRADALTSMQQCGKYRLRFAHSHSSPLLTSSSMDDDLFHTAAMSKGQAEPSGQECLGRWRTAMLWRLTETTVLLGSQPVRRMQVGEGSLGCK